MTAHTGSKLIMVLWILDFKPRYEVVLNEKLFW